MVFGSSPVATATDAGVSAVHWFVDTKGFIYDKGGVFVDESPEWNRSVS